MRVGVILLCRASSRRLPRKALLPLHGKPLIEYIIERIRCAAPVPLVVATSVQSADDEIASYCSLRGVECYRGSLDDVASRFLDCAERSEFDYAVRINGDNVFMSPQILRSMLTLATDSRADLITNVPGRTFPTGMSVEIVRTAFLRKWHHLFTAEQREHVTSYFYDNPNTGSRREYRNRDCPEAAGMALAIDTAEDFALATAMLRGKEVTHTEFDLQDWVSLCRTLRSQESTRSSDPAGASIAQSS